MPFGRHKYKRRWLALTALLGTVLLLLLAEPVWFPWVLKPIAGRAGLSYGAYERLGWKRCRLHNVKGVFGGTSFRASRLDAPLALPFLTWRFLPWSSPEANKVRIEVEGWDVTVEATESVEPGELDSTSAVLDLIEAELPTLRRWLPRISLRNGSVTAGGRRVSIPSIAWDGVELLAGSSLLTPGFPVEVVLSFPTNRLAGLVLSAPDRNLKASVAVDRSGDDWRATGSVEWKGNVVALNAGFGAEGFLPAHAAARGRDLSVPLGAVTSLGQTEIADGRFELNWRTNTYSFQADLQVRAEQVLTNGLTSLSLAGDGDLERVRLDQFLLAAPGVEARLEVPINLTRELKLEHDGSSLRWTVDLARFSSLRAQGVLRGELAPGTGALLSVPVAFRTNAEDLDTLLGRLDSLTVSGDLTWPELHLTEATVEMTNGLTFALSAAANLARRELARASWRLSGALPPNLFPAGIDVSPLDAAGTLEGEFGLLRHSGDIKIERIGLPALQPLRTEVSWQGFGVKSVDFTAAAEALEAGVLVEGTCLLNAADLLSSSVVLRGVALSREDTTLLALERPCELNLARQPSGGAGSKSLMGCEWSPLELRGNGSSLSLAGKVVWPAEGDVALLATNLQSEAWSGFLKDPAPSISIRRLRAAAAWNRGPAEFDIEVALTAQAAGWPSAGFAGRVRSEETGVRVESLALSLDRTPLLEFSGEFPAKLLPGRWPEVLELEPSADLNATLELTEDAAAWTKLKEVAGVGVEQGMIQAEVGGSVSNPVARLRLAADSITLPRRLGTNVPPIQQLRLALRATPAEFELEALDFQVLGQPVQASGILPLQREQGLDWWRNLPTPVLSQASGRLLAENIQLTSLTNVVPTVSLPAGELWLDLNVIPGPSLLGFLRVTNVVTGVVPELGALRDLHARVVFTNDVAVIEHGQARLSGQPLSLSGQVRLLTNDLPVGSIRIVGTNLSLARSRQLFLRGTADITVSREPEASPVIGGLVSLTNSLVMPDLLDAMVDVTRPERRPPYFSVPQAPFADWRLDLRVEGQRFARVASPFFKGVVSLGLNVGGTLKEPIALGDATVNSGRILFPFGGLDVELGRISLTEESPFRPELAIKASGMSFGYAVQMDLQGPLDSFNMGLSAVPPLTSKEILLMLAAGEVPRNDFSFTQTDKASRIGYYFGSKAISNLLGQDPGADRLEIRTGEYVDDRGGLTYSVEYRLTDRLYAIGIYDRFRTFNAGLKFRIYSK